MTVERRLVNENACRLIFALLATKIDVVQSFAAAQVEQNTNGLPGRTVMESTIDSREEETAACGAMGTGQ